MLEKLLDEAVRDLVSNRRLLLLQALNELPDEVPRLGLHLQDVIIGCQTQIRDVSVQGLEEHREDTVSQIYQVYSSVINDCFESSHQQHLVFNHWLITFFDAVL